MDDGYLPGSSRLAEKLDRVVIENLALLRFGEIRTSKNFFCGVVPPFAVRQIGGIKHLIFAEESDLVHQHLVVGFAGEKDSASSERNLGWLFAELQPGSAFDFDRWEDSDRVGPPCTESIRHQIPEKPTFKLG